MENLRLAQIEFKKLNFYRSLEYYIESLNAGPLNSKEKILCCQKILLISKKIKQKIPDQLLKKIGKIYLQKKLLKEAVEVFELLIAQSNNSENFELICSTLISLGELTKAKRFVLEFLYFLLEKKLAMKGLNILESFSSGIFNKDDYLSKKIYFSFFKCDVNELSNICLELDFQDQKVRIKHLKSLLEVLDRLDQIWMNHISLVENILELLLKNTTLNDFSLKREKVILIKIARSSFVNEKLRPKAIELVKLYASSFERNQLARLVDYLIGSEDNFKLNQSGILDADDYKLKHDQEGKEENNEKISLIRDIKFLLSIKRPDKAYKLALKLQEIDPHNSILKTIFNETLDNARENKEYGFNYQFRSTHLHKSKNESILERNERIIKKIILTMPVDTLEKYCSDFVFALNSLNFYNVAIELLHYLERKNCDKRRCLKHQYLLVETLFMAGKMYDALDVIDKAIQESIILKDDNLEFIYLKGEIFISIGLKKNALEIFRFIEKLDTGFRFTKERIKQLEKHK